MPPSGLGYQICIPPCESNVITSSYDSVASCLKGVTQDFMAAVADAVDGMPAVPGSNAPTTICQRFVDKGLRKYFVTRVKEQ